jgi:hypothetical protein
MARPTLPRPWLARRWRRFVRPVSIQVLLLYSGVAAVAAFGDLPFRATARQIEENPYCAAVDHYLYLEKGSLPGRALWMTLSKPAICWP